jgi:predicted nucleic acid-binding protein
MAWRRKRFGADERPCDGCTPMTARPTDVAYGDTNIFVALFASSDHPLHDRALQLFRRVAEGDLTIIVTNVVMAELCFVTGHVLGWTRRKTVAQMTGLLDADGVVAHEPVVMRAALDLFGRHGRLDFPDAYLAARALADGPGVIATFDRALASVPNVRAITG